MAATKTFPPGKMQFPTTSTAQALYGDPLAATTSCPIKTEWKIKLLLSMLSSQLAIGLAQNLFVHRGVYNIEPVGQPLFRVINLNGYDWEIILKLAESYTQSLCKIKNAMGMMCRV
jgi:hypothetical protein